MKPAPAIFVPYGFLIHGKRAMFEPIDHPGFSVKKREI